MSAYYNEIEPFAAAWLRNLIAAGHIAPGDVDDLRAYGNAINAKAAQVFIGSVM